MSVILSISYFMMRRDMGSEVALKTWLLMSAIPALWIALFVLRDHARQTADVRRSTPIIGNCERLGDFTYIPIRRFWVASSVMSPVGELIVQGAGSKPLDEQIAIWECIAPRLSELIEIAFTSLFFPETDSFRQAGIGLLPTRIVLGESNESFKVKFDTFGFPPGLLLNPTVVFDAELNPQETDWQIGV